MNGTVQGSPLPAAVPSLPTSEGFSCRHASSEAMRDAGEEAVRPVAAMRHPAIDDWEQVARFTQAALRENGLSYREQESHTGVGASTVYQMAQGNSVEVPTVQQFAAFAAHGARRAETRSFWAGLLARLCPSFLPAARGAASALHDSLRPNEIAALYARLTLPASRKSVTDLLCALEAAEAAATATVNTSAKVQMEARETCGES